MSDLGKRRLGDSWLVLPAKRGISVFRLRCVAHVLAVSILVHLPPMPRESYEQRSATQQSLQLWLVLFERFRVGVQKARELWQQLALHTLLHPAALLHEKLPLLLFCLGFVFSTDEKQSAVNHQGCPMFLQDKEV